MDNIREWVNGVNQSCVCVPDYFLDLIEIDRRLRKMHHFTQSI